jgi:hypothetical protein
MRNKVIFSIVIGLLFSLTVIISCTKDNENYDCYSEELYQANKNNICPHDCPGVIGCDEKFYCNGCEALKQGIKVKE